MGNKILKYVFILVAAISFLFLVENVEAALDSNELEYTSSIGPITGSTSANYVYASLFNPSGSGKTAVIKKLSISADTVAAAVYQTITVRRITNASAGTQIPPANITKKNTDSANTVLEVRHTNVAVTLAGTANSRLMYVVAPGAAGSLNGYKEVNFGDNEKLILQPGEGIALYTEAAGDADQRIRLLVEWEDVTNAPASQGEYLFNYPRVEAAATANYVYSSFFNPSASGKTAIVKRIAIEVHCDAAAVYTNNIAIRRITNASGGTAISAGDVPKKHTNTTNTTMGIRSTGVTVTFAGNVSSRLAMVTPCAAANEAGGVKEIVFASGDEKLILQPGEGIALYTEAAGDADQITRMFIEWQEVSSASTPASQGEYTISYPRVELAAAANAAYHTFFNPAASGKTAIVKRIEIRLDADAVAVYQPITVRRITAASGGTSVLVAADVPKKHTNTTNTTMELRAAGATAITVTFAGTVSSRLLGITGQAAVGQLRARKEVIFGTNEKLILQPGEGIALYTEAAGDVDQYVKFSVEWGENTTPPASQGEYMISIGPISGSTASGYNYTSFFNPAASGKTAIVKRVWVGVDAVAAAVYIPFTLRRTTNASGGTAILAADVPKKHTSTANTSMNISHTGVKVTFAGTANSRLVGVQSPGAVGTAVAPQLTGLKELIFENDEKIILKPGEGFALYQEAAGDADFRVRLLVEWDEETTTPASQGEYLMSIGPISGSTASGYNYTSFFNPAASGKDYVVKRIEATIAAVAAANYIPITIRGTTAASGGTLINASDIPKKHTSTANSTAEVRHTGVNVTLSGVNDSRIVGVTSPGAVGMAYGDYETVIIFGDELILKPGKGLVLFQEAAGDADFRVRFAITWNESTAAGAAVVYGSLNGTLISPTGTNSQPQNQTFLLKANVTCIGQTGAVCRTVNGTARYNATTTNPDTFIQGGNIFATPFYTIEANPGTCGTMNQSSPPCNLTWTVNATGTIGSGYKIDVNFTSNDTNVASNKTNFTTINIISQTLSITISAALANVQFGSSLTPGTTNNNATNNSINTYNITCDYQSGNCNISIKANSDMISGSNTLGIGNVSWNQINNPATEKILTFSYNVINATLGHLMTQLIYFWIDIPGAQPAGNYKGNFTIQGQPN